MDHARGLQRSRTVLPHSTPSTLGVTEFPGEEPDWPELAAIVGLLENSANRIVACVDMELERTIAISNHERGRGAQCDLQRVEGVVLELCRVKHHGRTCQAR